MQSILEWFSNFYMAEENHLLDTPEIMKSFSLYCLILSIFVSSCLSVLSSENVAVWRFSSRRDSGVCCSPPITQFHPQVGLSLFVLWIVVRPFQDCLSFWNSSYTVLEQSKYFRAFFLPLTEFSGLRFHCMTQNGNWALESVSIRGQTPKYKFRIGSEELTCSFAQIH